MAQPGPSIPVSRPSQGQAKQGGNKKQVTKAKPEVMEAQDESSQVEYHLLIAIHTQSGKISSPHYNSYTVG